MSRFTNLSTSLLTGLFSVGIAGLAAAGVVIEYEHTDQAGVAQKAEVWIDGHDLAAEMAEGKMIFRGKDQVVWFTELNNSKNEYTEITSESIAAISAQMEMAKQMMEQQLAGLPDEQRAMAEGMMKKQMGQVGMLGDDRVESLGKKDIDGKSCLGYKVYSGDELVLTAWTTDVAEFGLKSDQFAAFRDLETFMGGGNSPIKQMMGRFLYDFSAKPSPDRVSGLPVRMEGTGMQAGTVRLVSIENSDVPDGIFDEPTDRTKKSISDLGGLGG